MPEPKYLAAAPGSWDVQKNLPRLQLQLFRQIIMTFTYDEFGELCKSPHLSLGGLPSRCSNCLCRSSDDHRKSPSKPAAFQRCLGSFWESTECLWIKWCNCYHWLLTAFVAVGWVSLRTGRVYEGGWPFSWWYFGNVGNMSQMFAQCGFLLYGFPRFPTDSSLDDRGISTLRWRNIPMRKPHMRPGRPKFLTCGRNRFKVGPTLRHISVNRVTLTRVWGHWRKPIFYRGNMFSTRWDGCLSDCPVAGGWLHRNRRLRSCLARPWKPFPFVFPIRAGHEILTNHLRLPSCLSAVFQLPSFLLMWFEFHTFSTQVLVQFIPNWDGLKRRWAKWLKLRKPFRLAWGWQRWGMQGTCSIYLNMYICYTIIS